MRARIVSIVVLFGFLGSIAFVTGGCSKLPGRKKGGAEQGEGASSGRGEIDARAPVEQPISKELEDLLARSTPIKELTPELFVALTIKHLRESKRWVEESKSLTADEQKEYIDKANKSFFGAYGTTEDAFVKYSQNHIDELNSYMSDHPELMKDLAIED